MKNLLSRLQATVPIIAELLKISGGAGGSVGVLHQSEIVYTAHFGCKDLVSRDAPDDETTYYLASLSKAFTAMGIATLVEEGKLHWDDLLSSTIPEFQYPDLDIRNHATIIDMLSHRTGLASKMALWMGEHSRVMIRPADFTRQTLSLERVQKLRSTFLSNNWLYGLAGQIIEHLSGESFSTYLESRFFRPLMAARLYKLCNLLLRLGGSMKALLV
jgi:CubicO group peptidase (beta-lactamase class C family)